MEKKVTLTKKSSKIRQIFETMEYPKGRVNTGDAEAWLQTLNLNFKLSEDNVKTILNPSIDWQDICDQLKNNKLVVLLNRYADTLEAKVDIICQLEVKCRGILPKDTLHSMKIFVENLRYFSSWAADTTIEKINEEALFIIPNTCSLLMFGYAFAAGLSNGHCMYLHTGAKISPIITFLINEAIAAGFPESLLTIIPENISISAEFMVTQIKGVICLHNTPKIELRNMFDGFEFCSIAGGKIPMIIFNNADIDSACEAVIQAAWGQQGLVPWSVSTVLVQEDIFENVVEKLKIKISKAKMGSADDIQSEITYPSLIDNFENKLKNLVDEAQRKGIDFYQPMQKKPFCPTLFIGGRVTRNSVLGEDDDQVPTVTVLPFRDTTEAIKLANNSKQGFAASVWTENLNLANEVSKKLEVGTIWVNMHGKFRADISFTSHKCQYGYFGGAAGFHQFTQWQPVIDSEKNEMANINIEHIRRFQVEWKNLSYSERSSKMRKVALTLNNLKDKIDNETSCGAARIENCIEWMMTTPLQPYNYNNASDVKSSMEPIGIILTCADEYDNLKHIISAIYHGNSCIVMTNQNRPLEKLMKKLESFLAGLLTVVPFHPTLIKNLKYERSVNILCHYNIEFWIPSDITKYGICKIKNVWCNSDYSFI